jgi:hypothetical protein
MHREKAGYFLPAGRWADRRGATLVGVVQLLI